jgi:hypothetical protein
MPTNEDLRTYLTKKLAVERAVMNEMEGLYLGTSPLAFIDPDTLRALGGRVQALPLNLARLAVDVVASRCQVSGFRSSTGDVVDNELVSLWRGLGLPDQSQLAHLDALVYGRAYFLAWGDGLGAPIVTAESPLQFTVTRDPITREIVSALKRWRDASGFSHSLLLTPETITEYVSRNATAPDPAIRTELALTVLGEDMIVEREEPNTLGKVPVVALVNRARLSAPDGESELSDLSAPVKAVSKLASDMLVASEFAAVPRRYALFGGSLTREQAEEAQGALIKSAASPNASRFTVLGGGSGGDKPEVGSFTTAELTNFEAAITLLIGQVAAIASLPPYYVDGNSPVNPVSAEAMRSGEARLTSKAKQRQTWWSEPYASLMRLSVLIRDGVEDPRLSDLETLWVDCEPSTVAQTSDAVAKTFGAGIIDRRAALTELGFSPLETERILAEAALADAEAALAEADAAAEPMSAPPPVVNVNVPDPAMRTRTIQRDAQGFITAVVDTAS